MMMMMNLVSRFSVVGYLMNLVLFMMNLFSIVCSSSDDDDGDCAKFICTLALRFDRLGYSLCSDCYDQLLKHWPNVYLALENNLEIVPVSTGSHFILLAFVLSS